MTGAPKSWIGQSIERVEDDALLSGRGRFIDDLAVRPDTLHAAILRSQHAHAKIRAIDAELKLKEQASAAPATDTSAQKAKVDANPADHQARYDYALALDAAGDRDGALAQLLDIVKRDRKWNEEAARKHLVTLFEAMGPTDPRTIDARRKLSSILFS